MKQDKLFLLNLCLMSQLLLGGCSGTKEWDSLGKNKDEIEEAYYCTRTNLFDSDHEPYQLGGSLKGIRSLFNYMGNPQLQIPTIHITGTNGKGSTARKLAASFMEAGYRVGEYISPYLFTVREDITINLEMISIEDFIEHHQICANADRDRRKDATESIKKPGSDGVLKCQNDLVFVLHGNQLFCGKQGGYSNYRTRGGYTDHTNCLLPEVSIITNVQIDHPKNLGNTREKIMYEKTGIIKEGIPVVLGNDMPLRIAMREAKKRNSSHYVVYPDDPHNFTFDHLNAKVTRKVLSLLLHKYPLLTEEAIARGVKARLRSRLEEATPQILQLLALKWGLTKLPYKVFHEFKTNIGSLTRIFKELRQGYPNHKLRVVMTGHRRIMVTERLKATFANTDYLHFIEDNNKKTLRLKEYDIEGLMGETNFDKTKFELYDEESTGGPRDLAQITKHAFELSSQNTEDEVILLLGFDGNALRILGYNIQEEINPKRKPSKSDCTALGIRLIPRRPSYSYI